MDDGLGIQMAVALRRLLKACRLGMATLAACYAVTVCSAEEPTPPPTPPPSCHTVVPGGPDDLHLVNFTEVTAVEELDAIRQHIFDLKCCVLFGCGLLSSVVLFSRLL